MRIFKKILVAAVILLGANGQLLAQGSRANTDSVPSPDTNAAFTDPKKGFDALFLPPSSNEMQLQQLNPLAVSFVQDYISRFGKTMENMKTWGKPYFDMMDNILEQHGLPHELKYLAVIESHLQSNVRSWAGAVGPWQFMPQTARNYGLRVSRYRDERTDYFKSTHAASRYLTELYRQYGDWLLVIAAYNGGPGNVNNAIKKAGSRNFWALQDYLPVESKNHVKKFIATHYIMEGTGGITTSTKDELNDLAFTVKQELRPGEIDSSRVQPISGRYLSAIIIKYTQTDPLQFKRFNPDFDNQMAVKGSFDLRLPKEKMDLFLEKRSAILNECISYLLNPPTEPAPPVKKAF